MVDLDITITRDFATLMALTSNHQGRNGNKALDNFKAKMGNSSWSDFCSQYWQPESENRII